MSLNQKIAENVSFSRLTSHIGEKIRISLRTVERQIIEYLANGQRVAPCQHKLPASKQKVTQSILNIIRPTLLNMHNKQKSLCLLAGVAEQRVRYYLKRDLDNRSYRPVPKPWVTCTNCIKRLAFATQ